MNYPAYLNTMNVYVGDSLLYENEPCPESEGNETDWTETLRRWLEKESLGNKWKLTDEDQQGMRGWFEYTDEKGCICVVFIRSEVYCDLTNIAPPPPPVGTEFTFNMYGPFSMIRAAEAANKTVRKVFQCSNLSVSFWHRWFFDESSEGDELREFGYPFVDDCEYRAGFDDRIPSRL